MAELPNNEALGGLSWYGASAYVTRCARRAQPLYITNQREGPAELERVIVALEEFVRGEGSGFEPIYLFTNSRFSDLPFEMAASVYTARAAGEVTAAAGNGLSFDDDTIVEKAVRAATIGKRAYEMSRFAPNEEARALALESYTSACQTDVAALTGLTGAAAGTLGSPLDLAVLGSLWPDGAPSWPQTRSRGITTIPRPRNVLVHFEDLHTGSAIINPDFVVIAREDGADATQVVLHLGSRTETVVLPFSLERVRSRLLGEA